MTALPARQLETGAGRNGTMLGFWGYIKEFLGGIFRRPESGLMGHYDTIIDELGERIKTEREEFTKRLESCENRCIKCEQDHGKTQLEMISLRNLVERIEQQGLVAQITANELGIITEWNPAATTLFHYAREEALGQNISIITPHEYRQRHLKAFRVLASKGGEPRSEPLLAHAMTRNGNRIPVSIQLNGWEIDGKWHYGAAISRRVEG
jgi:PAS domain S-box-containing protein